MTHPLVAEARKYVGSPYCWAAKGDKLFDAGSVRLIDSPWLPMECFDCSGLVTTSLHRLGLCDWRASHSAATLRQACTPIEFGAVREGDLLFRPKHVAIVTDPGASGRMQVIEASGGDQSTLSPMAAARRTPKAEVREHLTRVDSLMSNGMRLFQWAGRLASLFPPHVVSPFNGA